MYNGDRGQSLGFCYHCLHLFPYHPTIKGEKEREETSNVYFRVIMLDAALSRVGKNSNKKNKKFSLDLNSKRSCNNSITTA